MHLYELINYRIVNSTRVVSHVSVVLKVIMDILITNANLVHARKQIKISLEVAL